MSATRDFAISKTLTADLVDAAAFDVVAGTWEGMETKVEQAREREGYPKVLATKRTKTYYKRGRREGDGSIGYSECSESDEWELLRLSLFVTAARS